MERERGNWVPTACQKHLCSHSCGQQVLLAPDIRICDGNRLVVLLCLSTVWRELQFPFPFNQAISEGPRGISACPTLSGGWAGGSHHEGQTPGPSPSSVTQ